MTTVDVSVIVCTYNRSNLLERTLKSVAAQQVPGNIEWEVIVVDNASTDATPEVARRFADQYPNIRCVREERQGLSHARNRGIDEAAGALVCFVDDDVRLPTDYVARAHAAWKNGSWGVAGGRAVADYEIPRPTWIDRLPRQMLNAPFGVHDRGEHDFIIDDSDEIVPIGANMLIPRAVFEKIGKFDTELGRTGKSLRSGEDTEFYERARRAGLSIGYCGSCPLWHFVPRERLKRRFFVRWKFRASLTGGREVLPADTVYWLRVPRYEWRSLAESFFRLVTSVVVGRRTQRLIQFSGELGRVIGRLTGRRRTAPAAARPRQDAILAAQGKVEKRETGKESHHEVTRSTKKSNGTVPKVVESRG